MLRGKRRFWWYKICLVFILVPIQTLSQMITSPTINGSARLSDPMPLLFYAPIITQNPVECHWFQNSTYTPVFHLPNVDVRCHATFKLARTYSGLSITAYVLFLLLFSDVFINSVTSASNGCISRHIDASLRRRQLTSADILQFMAILCYLGFVRLPAKTDLW